MFRTVLPVGPTGRGAYRCKSPADRGPPSVSPLLIPSPCRQGEGVPCLLLCGCFRSVENVAVHRAVEYTAQVPTFSKAADAQGKVLPPYTCGCNLGRGIYDGLGMDL